MQYAEALPALITDNIGAAPLTVCDRASLDVIRCINIRIADLDFHSQADDSNSFLAPIYQTYMEIFGRA